MRNVLFVSVLALLPACQPEPVASVDVVATDLPSDEIAVEEIAPPKTPADDTSSKATPGGPDELTLDGIGPVKLGMTYASLTWAGLQVESIDGGVAVGPYRAGFAPAKGGPITSVHVRLGDLPGGLLVGGKLLKNETTSMQELADAVGECEPIAPNIGSAETTCHGGRIVIRGAGPVGGLLAITVKTS
ncbi:MAG: hypothetical protein HOV80_29745 [Polyangiaceae bacterium]|nr:hypothetical protein [Polyangiaceae bacterium]